jgi:DNA invertase Pin-like site-specific DNA recombinase
VRENNPLRCKPGTGGDDEPSALRGITAPSRAQARRQAALGSVRALPPADSPSLVSTVIGYVSGPGAGVAARRELERQARVIAQECEDRGLRLVEVVRDREPLNGKALCRPGLAYALDRISAGEVSGLVVCELFRVTRSASELGTIIEWLTRSRTRLIAVAHGLDTNQVAGHLAANVLVEVSRWESQRLSERTRNGLRAARGNGRGAGRPAVVDNPQLRERIVQMRAQGMTLQAIADRLNDEGVPTVRGGTKWRHSSVQAAAGYARRRRTMPVPQMDQSWPATPGG